MAAATPAGGGRFLPRAAAMPASRVQLTPEVCVAARRLLNCAQAALAKASGVDVSIIIDFEKERREVSANEIALIRRALEKAGVNFSTEQPTLRPEVAAAQPDLIHAVEFYERLKPALLAQRLI
jgi:transcriptional regulator with XRE-family HTH domain